MMGGDRFEIVDRTTRGPTQVEEYLHGIHGSDKRSPGPTESDGVIEDPVRAKKLMKELNTRELAVARLILNWRKSVYLIQREGNTQPMKSFEWMMSENEANLTKHAQKIVNYIDRTRKITGKGNHTSAASRARAIAPAKGSKE